jgi:hypothetical protein
VALNARQQRFVAEYAIDMNATQAAIRAGYSEKTAYAIGFENLRKPEIAAAVAQTQAAVIEAVTEQARGSAAWIVERAAEVVERALNVVPVRDSKGRIVEGEWTCNLSAATPALALLARRHPEFSEKHEVTGDVRLRVEALSAVAQMSPEQLAEVAARARLA